MAKTLGLIGRKLGMTRIFGPGGKSIPVTVIEAGPCPVIQKKDKESDGYASLQVGFDPLPAHRLTKPNRGHQQKANKGFFRHLREFRLDDVSGYEQGQDLDVGLFAPGERVKVSATSKGKGFAGVMKRWNFKGSPASHGHEKVHRKPGAVGQCADPARVFKGKHMPGQMGAKVETLNNSEIVDVRAEENLLLIRGQVPGPRGGIVIVRKKS
mgnify:FL=1